MSDYMMTMTCEEYYRNNWQDELREAWEADMLDEAMERGL